MVRKPFGRRAVRRFVRKPFGDSFEIRPGGETASAAASVPRPFLCSGDSVRDEKFAARLKNPPPE
ncbi:hypothetical protein HMPREF9720_1672 [Alistipes sp. HGB5]|nr:hypothetical protein HMPREF9720_1672 [Alistipes sp. HGB5]